MNDNTAKLIEQLASKMGTTSEYLWNVLLHQAPINATVTLLQFILIGVGWVFAVKAHKYASNDDNNHSYYNDDIVIGGMIVFLIILTILTFTAFFFIEQMFNGFFNPEFWALDYILNRLHH